MITAIEKPELNIRVFENRELMGEDAAKMVGQKMRELLATQPFINMIFAAAPSQNEFLKAISEAKDIDWTRVNAFHMDEYLGLPADAPQGFGNFLKERLFSRLPFHTVNYINGNATDIQQECERYAALLQRYPADIVCMGIGENGHIAFNDPPVADFNDNATVKMVMLDEICRQQQVNDNCFPIINMVPLNALTLTIPVLMKARFVYCIVPGQTKARAVLNTLNENIDEQYPSTILRNHPNATLFLDKHSSRLL